MILAFFALLAFLLVAKLLASTRSLFGDEAFYWMCGQRLDIAFSDHPFMTALLVRGGVDLLGSQPSGVRFLFILFGMSLPFIVFLIARPLLGRRDAWLAAGTSLIIPATAHLGIVAIPDVPLLVYSALALLGFERATRTNSGVAWLFAGLATALALATHLRGVLIPMSFALYLFLTPRGRSLLRSAGPWLAGIISLAGLLPVLLFNIRHDFLPIRFQSVERHGGGIDLDGLVEHLPLQAVVVTPFMYVALICVLVSLARKALAGDDRSALFVLFALGHLAVFFLMSPFSDNKHATIHWPAPGYLPLIIFFAPTMRDFVARQPTRWRRFLGVLVPGFAVFALVLVCFELATGYLGAKWLHRAFAGWAEAGDEARRLLTDIPKNASGRHIVVADNYLLAGNLEIQLGEDTDIYVLDHPKNREHGRALQLQLWNIEEEGIGQQSGSTALIVLDADQTSRKSWEKWLDTVQTHFDPFTQQSAIVTPGKHAGRERFFFYRGKVLTPPP